jgi:cytochrome b subunit of formate dehydrogenase
MAKKEAKPLRFDEDAFDLEKAKRGLNTVALAKARNRKLHLILKVAKFLMMLGGFGLFLLLFYLAMEIIALF